MGMNPRLLRPLASGFDPRRIAGLAAWFDMGKSVLTFNGTNLSLVTDLSGNGRDFAQTDAARQPGYSATDASGKPAMLLGGVFGAASVITPAWDFVNTVTIFTVCNNTVTSFGGVFQRGAVNERHSGYRGVSGSPNVLYARRGGSNEGSVAYSGGYAVMQWSFSTALSRVSVNGTAGTDNTSSVSYNSDAKALRVGSLGDGTLNMAGGIAEFLYYDALLSGTQAAAVRRYLGTKYGISTT